MNYLIYNWTLLLRAIMLSDYDDGSNYVVCIYDVHNSGVLVGVFNNDKRLARILNMEKDSITSMRNKKQLIKKKYYTKRIECETTSSKLEYYQIINSEINKKELDYIRRMSL